MAATTDVPPSRRADLVATGGFTVQPNAVFGALAVPQARSFVLTDIICFPLVDTMDGEFVLRYRIEEHAPGDPVGAGTKFQFNAVGTSANWSQHFSSGIRFAGGRTVDVVNTSHSTGTAGFQLLGYWEP